MTTLTMRYIKGDFVVTGPDISQPSSRRAERPRTGAWRITRARPSKRSVRSTTPRAERPTVTRRAVLCPGDADSDAEAARIALLANVANVRATLLTKTSLALAATQSAILRRVFEVIALKRASIEALVIEPADSDTRSEEDPRRQRPLVSTGAARQGTSLALSADGNVAIVGGLARMVWAAHRGLPAVARSGAETLVSAGAVGKSSSSVALSARAELFCSEGRTTMGGIGPAWTFAQSAATGAGSGVGYYQARSLIRITIELAGTGAVKRILVHSRRQCFSGARRLNEA
jgi:hypothetical protein